MRKLLFLAVLLLLPTGFGKELAGHTVMASIGLDGNAHVMEKYTLQLNLTEYEDFERIARTTSTDISMWQLFFKDINTTVIGDITGLIASASTAGAGNFGNNVILNYDVNGFALFIQQVGRDNYFEIHQNEFSFYDSEINKFIIPWKTELQLRFDPHIKKTDIVDVTPSPSQSAIVDDRYTLFWYGSKIDNTFNVRYRVEQNVGEFDAIAVLSSVYMFFYESPVNTLALVITLILVFIYRKPMIGLISDSFGGEEEIELPKRGV